MICLITPLVSSSSTWFGHVSQRIMSDSHWRNSTHVCMYLHIYISTQKSPGIIKYLLSLPNSIKQSPSFLTCGWSMASGFTSHRWAPFPTPQSQRCGKNAYQDQMAYIQETVRKCCEQNYHYDYHHRHRHHHRHHRRIRSSRFPRGKTINKLSQLAPTI